VAVAVPPPQDEQTRQAEENEQKRMEQHKKQQAEDKKQNESQDQTVNVRVIHLEPVAVGRDFGTQVEILSGLKEGDLVVVNPNDDVREGVRVNAQPAKASADQQNKAGAKKQNGPGG
jgi:hypothetical protein